MRRILFSLLLALFFLPPSYADGIMVDGICYGLIGTQKAYVTHPAQWTMADEQWAMAYTGDVVIPSEISYGGRTYSVVSIGDNAFAGQYNLTSVHLPPSVHAVSPCAFLGCTALRQVSLSETMLVFSTCAFTGCTSLEQITLPRHTELVDSLTFYCCASLTSLVLPHRIRTVCGGALEHLPALTDLYCFASVPPVAELGAFTPSDQQRCTLHVPAEAVALYSESPLWSDFFQILPLSDSDYAGQNYQRGDINDDGRVDADDLALLRRLIVCLPDDASVRWAADINADGTVNAADYVALAKRL